MTFPLGWQQQAGAWLISWLPALDSGCRHKLESGCLWRCSAFAFVFNPSVSLRHSTSHVGRFKLAVAFGLPLFGSPGSASPGCAAGNSPLRRRTRSSEQARESQRPARRFHGMGIFLGRRVKP